MRRGWAIAAVLFSVGILAAFAYLWTFEYQFNFRPGAESPRAAIEAATTALRDGDADAWYAVSGQPLSTVLSDLGIVSVQTVNVVSVDQNRQPAVCQVVYADGETSLVNIAFASGRNLRGRWQVVSWHQSP